MLFIFDNFNNFIRKLTKEQKKSVFSILGSPLDILSFSLISQHPREVKKPYSSASQSMVSEEEQVVNANFLKKRKKSFFCHGMVRK